MSAGVGKYFQVCSLTLDFYLNEKDYSKVDQILDPNNLLRDINESHCCALGDSFRSCNYEYLRGIILAYFFYTVNYERSTYATAVQKFNGMKLLKDGYCIIML